MWWETCSSVHRLATFQREDMSEEIKSIRPYIKQLDKRLAELTELVQDYASPLEETLVKETDELKRLKTTNNYAYILASLMFSYVKLLSGHDTQHLNEKVMVELQRVRGYIERTKKLENKLKNKVTEQELKQETVKSQIRKTLGQPTISKQNFKNKHIKFEESNKVSKK